MSRVWRLDVVTHDPAYAIAAEVGATPMALLLPGESERNGRGMLHDFIVANRDVIIDLARRRVRERMPPNSKEAKLAHGVPLFLTQLADALARVTSPTALRVVHPNDSTKKINDSAALHGHESLRNGFTIAQVVHGYGDVFQIVTELATETNAAISAEDFHLFNRSLDDAIAGAVTAYSRHREIDLASEGTERRGVFVHELRNLLHGATMSFEVIKRGTVGLSGSTGAMLARCLSGLSALVDSSLAEVRLESGAPRLQRILVAEFIGELEVEAKLQAEGSDRALCVGPVENDLSIDADRQLLTSAVSNLLQNAFKFTPAIGTVSLLTRASTARVFIDICDECGGLPPGAEENLFRPFIQRSSDRSGLGLGLMIAQRAVRANGGYISVRDIPGTGCVFTIDLPRRQPQATISRLPPHSDGGVPEASGDGSKSEATRANQACGLV
jgi:signal transduction histidine kinase